MSIAKVLCIASVAMASGAGTESALAASAGSAMQTQTAARAAAMSKTNMWAKYMIPMNFITAVAEKEMEKAHEKYHLALQKIDFMEIDRNSEEFEDAERHHKIANLLEQQLKEMIEGAKKQVKEQLQSVGLEAASLMQQTLKAQHEKYIDNYANKTSQEVTPMSLIQFVEGSETHVDAESAAPTAISAPTSMLETGVEYPVKAALNATEKAQIKSEKSMMATEIQKVYYINDADKARNDFMQKQMTKASLGIHAKDIPFERFRATPASQVQGKHETTFSNGKIASYVASYSDAAKYHTVANYLSHAKLLEKIGEEIYDDRAILIMEDDAQLKDHWMDHVDSAFETMPEDWDILKIGYWGGKKDEDHVNRANVHRACCYSDPGDHYQGNQAYLVKPSAIPRIMKALKKRPVADFDKVMLMAPQGKEQDLNTYALGESMTEHTEVGKSGRKMNFREEKMARVLDNIEEMAAQA